MLTKTVRYIAHESGIGRVDHFKDVIVEVIWKRHHLIYLLVNLHCFQGQSFYHNRVLL